MGLKYRGSAFKEQGTLLTGKVHCWTKLSRDFIKLFTFEDNVTKNLLAGDWKSDVGLKETYRFWLYIYHSVTLILLLCK